MAARREDMARGAVEADDTLIKRILGSIGRSIRIRVGIRWTARWSGGVRGSHKAAKDVPLRPLCKLVSDRGGECSRDGELRRHHGEHAIKDGTSADGVVARTRAGR